MLSNEHWSRAERPSRFLYGVDDLDPMDAQALLTPDAVERYMGVPLAHVPAPEGSAAESYARYFVGELFMGTFTGLGIEPEIYWMSELYGDGSMDPFIRRALDGAETIRADLPARQQRRARPGLAAGLGHLRGLRARRHDARHRLGWRDRGVCLQAGLRGLGHWLRKQWRRVAPFSGRAKLPFNVDWAAKWSHFDITVEGCGKDLATKGGSRDRSDAISREVFDREPPVNVPYEFLNVGGRKMSTSKGSGAAAHEMADLLPPELLRFLFLRHKPKRALEFDPEGDAIPGLFDDFDRVATATAGLPFRGELPPNPERIFRPACWTRTPISRSRRARFRPAFRHLTLLVQVPGVDLDERMAAEKGAPLDDAELAIVASRSTRSPARGSRVSHPSATRSPSADDVPAEVAELNEVQWLFLGDLAKGVAAEHPRSGDAWQDLIYRTGQARGVSSRDTFAAVYAAFLGRTNGPRAGWLLASLAETMVIARLEAAAAAGKVMS